MRGWMWCEPAVLALAFCLAASGLAQANSPLWHQVEELGPSPLPRELAEAQSVSSTARGPVELMKPISVTTSVPPAAARAPRKPAKTVPARRPVSRKAQEEIQDTAAAGLLGLFDSLATETARKAAAASVSRVLGKSYDAEIRQQVERSAYHELHQIRPAAIQAAADSLVVASMSSGSAQQATSEARTAMHNVMAHVGMQRASRGAEELCARVLASKAWDTVRRQLPEFLSEAVSPIAQLEAQNSVAVLLEHNKDLQAHPMRKALEAQTVDRTHHILQQLLDSAVSLRLASEQLGDDIVKRTAQMATQKLEAGMSADTLVAESNELATRLAKAGTAQIVSNSSRGIHEKSLEVAKSELGVVISQSQYLEHDMKVLAEGVLQRVMWREAPAAVETSTKDALDKLLASASKEMKQRYGVVDASSVENMIHASIRAKVKRIASQAYMSTSEAALAQMQSAATQAAKYAEGTGAHLPMGLAKTAAERIFMSKALPMAEKQASSAAVNASLDNVLKAAKQHSIATLMRHATQVGRMYAFRMLVVHGVDWSLAGMMSHVRESAMIRLEKLGIQSHMTTHYAINLALIAAKNASWTSRLPLLEKSIELAAVHASSSVARSAIAEAYTGGQSAMQIISDRLPAAIKDAVGNAAHEFRELNEVTGPEFPGQSAWLSQVNAHMAQSEADYILTSAELLYDKVVNNEARKLAMAVVNMLMEEHTFHRSIVKVSMQRILQVTAHLAARHTLQKTALHLSQTDAALIKLTNLGASREERNTLELQMLDEQTDRMALSRERTLKRMISAAPSPLCKGPVGDKT